MSSMRKSSRLRSNKNEKTSCKEKEEEKLNFDEENEIIYKWDEDSKIIDRYHLRKLRSSSEDIEEDVIFYGTLILIDLNSSKTKNVSIGDGIIIASDDDDNEFYIATIDALFETNDDEKHASVTWYFMPFDIPKSKRPAHYQKNEIFLCSVKSENLINAETIIDRCQINHTPLSEEESSSRSYFCEKSFDGKKFQKIEHLKSETFASAFIKKKLSDVKNDPLRRSPRKEDTSCSSKLKKTEYVSKSILTLPVSAARVHMLDASTAALNLLDVLDCSDVEEEEEDDEVTKKKWERESANVKNKKSQLSEKISMEKIKMFPLRTDNHCSNKVLSKELVIKVKKLDLKREEKENKPEAIRSSSRLSKKKLVIPKKKRRTSSESDPDVNSKLFEESDTSGDDTIYVDESTDDESIDVYTDDEQSKKSSETLKTRRSNNVTTSRPTRTRRDNSKKVVRSTKKDRSAYIPRRKTPLRADGSDFEKARRSLHVSAVPESLPCREKEFQEIYSFIEGKINSGTGGCMYISGVPGTGKTATMMEVLSSLNEAVEGGMLEEFDYVEINGMRLTQPHQAYVTILKQIKGIKATPDHASELLSKHFNQRGKKSTLLLVDELDLLWTKKQDVLYHIFDWPSHRHARLIVIAIANTMDLPERLMMKRVSSRLGLTRLSFLPYTYKQLQEIVMSRLRGLRAFDGDAIQFVARKIAAVSGDARRCLDICRRSIEIADRKEKSKSKGANIDDVNDALQEMFSSPMIQLIRSCSVHEKLFLRSIVAEFRRSGLEEATVGIVLRHHAVLAKLDGLPPPTVTSLIKVCNCLSSSKVILLEMGRHDIYARIRLNVSVDDVIFALNNHT